MKPRLRLALGLAALASFATPSLLAQDSVIDIDPLGTLTSLLYDINNRGQAVGQAELGNTDNTRAILWQDGHVTDLGALPDYPLSGAAAIDERGQIVGAATDGFRSRAVLWVDGAITDLTPPGWAWCVASDINSRGDVVGTCARPAGSNMAVLWRDGVLTELGVLPGSNESAAAAINDAGVVHRLAPHDVRGPLDRVPLGRRHHDRPAGAARDDEHACVRDQRDRHYRRHGDRTIRRQPAARRVARDRRFAAERDVGQRHRRGPRDQQPRRRRRGHLRRYRWLRVVRRHLQAARVAGTGSLPQAINDRGVAVGFMFTEGGPRFTAPSGPGPHADSPSNPRPVTGAPQPVFLGTLGGASSYATRVNDRRQIIGYSAIAPDREVTHPFLWENGVMRDLSADPGELSWADDINDQGHVVGGSADRDDGSTYGALWHNGITGRLPLLPGSNNCRATAVNDTGLVAGFCVF